MLKKLENGWMRFGNGLRWRIKGPLYLCEVDTEGNTPDFCKLPSTMSKLRRIKSYYMGKLKFGQLDEYGTAADILTANSMTESLGTVPSPLEYKQLREIYNSSKGIDVGAKLDDVVRFVAGNKDSRYLERREPGYINPIATPGRVSLGAHHILISTAIQTGGWSKEPDREARITELVLSLPSKSLFAAQLAIDYFNSSYSKHLNQPPLLAATYNAGSPRLSTKNDWNLVQYGEHIHRWVAYYNTCRKM